MRLDPFRPGTLLDARYRVDELIGRGGMGAVYRAHDMSLDRAVAVKVLGGADPSGVDVARFGREARLAAVVGHPGVVKVHAVGVHDGSPYYVMDLAPGRDLRTILDRGPLPSRRLARVVASAARVVAACHAQGILHRDLKPANLLVDEACDDAVRVVDFGLAVGGQEEWLTRTGELLGTPAYLAPEQVTGGAVDERTDVWGLGAVLWHGLAGRPPFVGPVPAALAEVAAGRVLRPSSARAGVDAALEALCLRAMAAEPAQRFPSAAALADELDRWTPAARRPRSSALVLVGVGVALAAGGCWWRVRIATDRTLESLLEWDGLACALGERSCAGGPHVLEQFDLGLGAGAAPTLAELDGWTDRATGALGRLVPDSPQAGVARRSFARLAAHRRLLDGSAGPGDRQPTDELVRALALLEGPRSDAAAAAAVASNALAMAACPPGGWRVRARAIGRLLDRGDPANARDLARWLEVGSAPEIRWARAIVEGRTRDLQALTGVFDAPTQDLGPVAVVDCSCDLSIAVAHALGATPPGSAAEGPLLELAATVHRRGRAALERLDPAAGDAMAHNARSMLVDSAHARMRREPAWSVVAEVVREGGRWLLDRGGHGREQAAILAVQLATSTEGAMSEAAARSLAELLGEAVDAVAARDDFGAEAHLLLVSSRRRLGDLAGAGTALRLLDKRFPAQRRRAPMILERAQLAIDGGDLKQARRELAEPELRREPASAALRALRERLAE